MPLITKNIIPAILSVASIWLVFGFIMPRYENIQTMRGAAAQYETAINNANEAKILRDKLLANIDSISIDNRQRLLTLLPDQINEPKFMYDFTTLASNFGIRFDSLSISGLSSAGSSVSGPSVAAQTVGPSTSGVTLPSTSGDLIKYGIATINISFESSYQNFLNYLAALESNLELVDTVSISLSPLGQNDSNQAGNTNKSATINVTPGSEMYKFDMVLNTYWLK